MCTLVCECLNEFESVNECECVSESECVYVRVCGVCGYGVSLWYACVWCVFVWYECVCVVWLYVCGVFVCTMCVVCVCVLAIVPQAGAFPSLWSAWWLFPHSATGSGLWTFSKVHPDEQAGCGRHPERRGVYQLSPTPKWNPPLPPNPGHWAPASASARILLNDPD